MSAACSTDLAVLGRINRSALGSLLDNYIAVISLRDFDHSGLSQIVSFARCQYAFAEVVMRGLFILLVLFAVSAWQHPHVADPIMNKAHAQY
jgi:hypothetical protein